MGKVFIITGALGHLGSTILQILVDRGQTVRGLALPGDDSIKSRDTKTAKIYYGDVCDIQSLSGIFETEPGDELIVIHAAGIVSISSKYSPLVQRVNVLGTKNIISKCVECGVKRLVYVSSVHAIPELPFGKTISEVKRFDPEKVRGLYAKTKAEATQCVLEAAANGLDAVVVHPSGIIGPNDLGHSHTSQLITDYLNGKLLACVKGGYDFVDVRDVAEGTIAAAERGKSGECYILSNRHIEIAELLDDLHEITGQKRVRKLPLWLAKATAPLAELYYKIRKAPPLFTRYSLFTIGSNSDFSHKKATEELGYKARPARATLRDTVDFLIKTGKVSIDRIKLRKKSRAKT